MVPAGEHRGQRRPSECLLEVHLSRQPALRAAQVSCSARSFHRRSMPAIMPPATVEQPPCVQGRVLMRAGAQRFTPGLGTREDLGDCLAYAYGDGVLSRIL